MRPVVVGMCDPHGRGALSPLVPNSAGARLYHMLHRVRPTPVPEYLESVELTNLLDGAVWHYGRARAAAPALRERLHGRVVVVLGNAACSALCGAANLPPFEWLEGWPGTAVCKLPHPSGLTRSYNDADVRDRAGRLLADEVDRYQAEQRRAA